MLLLHNPKIRDKEYHNEVLVTFIKDYISIGNENNNVLSQKSERLFFSFSQAIERIEASQYKDFDTEIDIEREN